MSPSRAEAARASSTRSASTGARRRATPSSLHGVESWSIPYSAPYLQGATIDFLNGLQESGFKIDNPNATAACGCGHSFQVEEGEAPADTAGGCGSGCSH